MLLRLLPPPLPLKTGLGAAPCPATRVARHRRHPLTSSSSLPPAAFILPGPQQRESAAPLQAEVSLILPSARRACPPRDEKAQQYPRPRPLAVKVTKAQGCWQDPRGAVAGRCNPASACAKPRGFSELGASASSARG